MDQDQLPGVLEVFGAKPGRYLFPLRGAIYELQVEHQHEAGRRRVLIDLVELGGCVDVSDLLPASAVAAPPEPLQLPAPATDVLTKTCSVCEQEKPLSAFGYNRRMPDGRQPRCYTCHAADMAARRRQPRQEQPAEPEPAVAPLQAAQSLLCAACREEKPLDAFGVNSEKRDGLQPKCKACINAALRAKRAQQPQAQVSEVAAGEASF